MYEQFFGLRERPFDLTPNPRYLVLTDAHREVLHRLQHGIGARNNLTLVLGEAGSGRTTVMRAAIAQQPVRVHCVHLHNPALTRPEFIEILAWHFGLSERVMRSKRKLRSGIERVLLERRNRGEWTALIVDEAQGLPLDVLEEVRLLASLEASSEPLMKIIIAGLPELAGRLNTVRLRKLNQRIGLRCELQPFSARDTAAYLASRIRAAGGAASQVFTREAATVIHEQSHGLPRLVSVIADSALLCGYAVVQRPVDADIVREICQDAESQAPSAGSSRRAAPRRSVGKPSVLQSARDAVTNGRRFAAVAGAPAVAFVHEPAPAVEEVVEQPAAAVEVVEEPAIAIAVVAQAPIAVEVVPEPAIAAEVGPEPAIAVEVVQPPAAAVELVPEPAIAAEVVLQPAALVAVVQEVVTPDTAKADALPLDEDDDAEIKEIFFNTYFEKVWAGPPGR